MTATRRTRPRANPRGQCASRRARRSRRSPTTRSCRTATPARWSRPNGTIEWLCVPRFDAPCDVRRAARPRRRRLPPRPLRHQRPRRAPLRAGHEHRRDDVDDAVGLGRRARRAHDRRRGRTASDPMAHTRPPTDTTPTACSCARSSASRAACRSSWSASRCSTTARAEATWDRRSTATPPPTRPTARHTIRLTSDLMLGIEGNRVRARHTLQEGERRFCALSWGRDLHGPRNDRGGDDDARPHLALLARLARRRPLPRPPVARLPAALGARAEGPHLHADRRDGRRARRPRCRRRRAASATGTTATRGCATRRSRCGGCTRSGSTGRPTTSCSSSPT